MLRDAAPMIVEPSPEKNMAVNEFVVYPTT